MTTPEEVTAALGAGWEHLERGDGTGHEWSSGYVGLVARTAGTLTVTVDDGEGEGESVWWQCPTAEAAIAVAHLLLAAEEVAGGAAVGGQYEMPWARAVKEPYGGVRVEGAIVTPRTARRRALDLLRAAREAEASDGLG